MVIVPYIPKIPVVVGGGGGWGEGRWGVDITLNFVCYVGWAPASSVYQKSAIPNKISGPSCSKLTMLLLNILLKL